jgi:hypothetical protein
MSKPLRIALLAVAIGFLSCDSPTEPPAEGRVSVGQVIQGSLSSTDSSDTYTFLALAGHTYSVSFEAIAGSIGLRLRDSASGTALTFAFDFSGGAGLDENVTFDLRPTANQVLLIEIISVTLPSTYRVRINDVPTTPEGRAARFAFGDTISEMLNSSFDVDDFVAAGQAGQEVVTLIEALGPAFTGQVVVEVTAPGSTDPLTSSGAIPGLPEGTNAERVVLPTSGDYRFLVRGLGTDNHRYTGPYRFRVIVIHRAPESIGAAVPLNTAISGEAIDDAGDVDEFTFPGTAGQWFNAFFQSTAPSSLQLEVFGSAIDPEPTRAFSNPADTSLFKNSTGRFRTLTSGSYGLRVQGLEISRSIGPYRLFVYSIDPAPESIGSAIVPPDTIDGETIERAGDFDDFTFTGTAGTEYNALFQALGGHGTLQLEVLAADSILGSVTSAGTDTSLRQTTGRFKLLQLPTSATHVVRVQGINSSNGDHTGPFRFSLYQIDPRPELGPDTLAFGDSVSTERIEVLGDRDEWRVTVPDSSGANVVVQLGSDAQGGAMQVDLLDSAGVLKATTAVSAANGFGVAGGVPLAPGRYTLRADPTRYNERSLMTGSYRIWLYRYKIGPETAPDTIAIGDTVSEASDPPGDVDVYRFFGTNHQHVRLALQGISGQPGSAFSLTLTPPSGAPFAFVGGPSFSGSLDENQTNRVDLPVTGWYRATVFYGSVPGPGFTDPGLYRFTIKPFSTLPEAVPEALAVGDSVVAEALDTLGDWDEYAVAATPGNELAILFYRLSTQQFPRMMAFDAVTGDTLIVMGGSSGPRGTTPFVVPASGEVRVSVSDGPFYAYTGGYYLRVMPVNRAPEVAPATFAIGDTVRGEALDPLTDIDEFNATGTPGQIMSPAFRLLADPQPAGRVITLEVVDPATGNVLVGNNAGLTGGRPTSNFFSPGTFVVPASGAYRVRVRAGALTPEDVGTAPYEFFVRPGP